MPYDPGPTEPNAKGMYNFASEYLQAANTLKTNMKNMGHSGPFNYTVSHAFELFLKSYLMSCGLTYKDLKKIGHGIQKLVNSCAEWGLEFSEDEIILASVINNLNAHNMQRYPMLGLFQIGPIGFAEPENLLMHVENYSRKIQSAIERK